MSSGADATATVEPTAAFGAPGTSSRAVRPPSFAFATIPVAAALAASALRSAPSWTRSAGSPLPAVPLSGEASFRFQLHASLPLLPAAPSPTTVTAPAAGGASTASSSSTSWPYVNVCAGLPAWNGPKWSAPSASIHASKPASAASLATCSHALRAAVDDVVRERRPVVDRARVDGRPAREIADDRARGLLLVALVEPERGEHGAAVRRDDARLAGDGPVHGAHRPLKTPTVASSSNPSETCPGVGERDARRVVPRREHDRRCVDRRREPGLDRDLGERARPVVGGARAERQLERRLAHRRRRGGRRAASSRLPPRVRRVCRSRSA